MAEHHERVGQTIGEYRLLRILGQGGFASVYLAEDRHEHTQVAIKVLQTHLINPDEWRSFLNEARTFRLRHPHIMPLLDFGLSQQDEPYLVMEYAPKGTLRDRHRHGERVPLPTVIHYVTQVATALQYAHQSHIVHRDVKPENMLLRSDDILLLSDFGIAMGSLTTSTQIIIGTLRYMAPELFAGKPQPASDQYALAIVVYEWLCGQYPFDGSAAQVMFQQTSTPPPPLHQHVPSISPDVEHVVLKALAKDPKARFASIQEFATALEDASQTSNSLAVPASPMQLLGTPSRCLPSDHTASATESTIDESLGSEVQEDDGSLGSEARADETFYFGAVPHPPHASPSQATSWLKHMKAQAQDLFSNLEPLRENMMMQAQDIQQKMAPLGKKMETYTVEFLQKSEQAIKDVTLRVSSESPHSSTILFPKSATSSVTPTSFFISYHKADRPWAEWIAWELEAANHSVILPTWDFQLGSRLEEEMQKAAVRVECTIIILSPDFLSMPGIQQEWTTNFQNSIIKGHNLFLPVCVRECGHNLEKLFGSIMHIDITGQDKETARKLLLNGVSHQRRKPPTHPDFPGTQRTRTFYNAPSYTQTNPQSPPTSTLSNIEIFVSYSHNDKELKDELEKYLKNLKRLHDITSWHDGEIPAGGEWEHEIEEHLSTADIILLLISQDFIASDYCSEQEMIQAMARHEAKKAYVIPIILRPAHWEITPFRKLQVLPTGGVPITLWNDRDAAFLDVAKGLQRAVERLTKKQW